MYLLKWLESFQDNHLHHHHRRLGQDHLTHHHRHRLLLDTQPLLVGLIANCFVSLVGC
jgi:hypothetical protein